MKVIIVSKVFLCGKTVSLGALCYDKRQLLRLIGGFGVNLDSFQIGQVLEITGDFIEPITLPNIEDFYVSSIKIVDEVNDTKSLILKKLDSEVRTAPWTPIYEGTVHWSGCGNGFVEQSNPPKQSMRFFITDRPWTRGKGRDNLYYYFEANNRLLRVKYVGCPNIPDVIPIRSLVKMSLSHWCHQGAVVKESSGKCFLQFTSFFSVILIAFLYQFLPSLDEAIHLCESI